MRILVENSKIGKEWKKVTFIKDLRAEQTLGVSCQEISTLMPANMAKSIEIRLNAMADFKHGVTYKGNVMAMFRDPADRDMFRDGWAGDEDWENIDV